MGKHIYLIGFMGAGKSTIAKHLQNKLNIPLIEMDQEIMNRQGMEIAEIFQTHGEAYFRDLESALIREIAAGEPSVVSCGGGVVLREENISLMRDSGMLVYLSARPETIFERVRHSTNRPLLNDRMSIEGIADLMEQRRPIYETACQYSVETDGKMPGEIADGIVVLRELRGEV